MTNYSNNVVRSTAPCSVHDLYSCLTQNIGTYEIHNYYDQIQQGTIGMYKDHILIIGLGFTDYYSFLSMHIIKVAFYDLLFKMTQNSYKIHWLHNLHCVDCIRRS